MSRVSIRTSYCEVFGSTNFSQKNGQTGSLFWGSDQGGRSCSIYWQKGEDDAAIVKLQSIAPASAEARADVIIGKGLL